ncbi:tetratricopeptide repeat protein [Mumia sp. Pv 4-285]|uniref:tetratricopeptide repeat protein n=1 Tax=Mumia qirimensis TaxID=3234852 RepID=UPI00351D9C53
MSDRGGQNRGGQGGRSGGQGRSGGSGGSGRSGGQGGRSGGPSGQGRSGGSGGSGRSGGQGGRSGGPGGQSRSGGPGGQSRSGGQSRGGSAPRGDRDDRSRQRRDDDRQPPARRVEGPPIPDGVHPDQLDKGVRRLLTSLTPGKADAVASHLVAAGILIDEDPDLAYKHARAARELAPRIGVIREAAGETAYAAGRWADALAELRAAKRMTGGYDHIALIADSERALGRPDRALKVVADAREKLTDVDVRVEAAIVAAGARRDLGQLDAALAVLQQEPLHSTSPTTWLARLRYTYADTLAEAGRTQDALEWFHRTLAADPQHTTDAQERITALETP